MDLGRRIKRRIKKWTDQRGPRIELQTQRECLTLGSEYGAHTVCPDELGPESVVYSVGVGEDVSFDLALAEHFGLSVHAFDPTPRSVEWVRSQNLPACFIMNAIALGTEDGSATFYKPRNPQHISHSMLEHDRVDSEAIQVPMKRLKTLMQERGHERLDVLKLDIEGLEYNVLEQILDDRVPVAQLLIEFHHQLAPIPYSQTRQAVERLNAHGYRVFHLREGEREISLIRET